MKYKLAVAEKFQDFEVLSLVWQMLRIEKRHAKEKTKMQHFIMKKGLRYF